ncbi:unnamed protein product [Larinioides sclopetarius]|uniref:EGF-like domain-containing protein n=1 Tax=Larinioides sclopetarius TaxID=280406 RepID=A0AAV1Z8N2_9ARAC
MEIHLLLFLCLGFLSQQKLVLGADNVAAYCSDGEEYQMCGACEKTCENPLSKKPCTTPCSPGCFCKAGLVRNRQKRCIPPKECNTNTTSCGENEEYLECGSSCPLTCSNYQESLFCTKQCTKGCFCKPGYVLGPNKKCIFPRDCPIGPCRGNEVATDCVNPCNNCAQRGKCTFEFCSRGCDCKHGHHRNSTGHCVEAKDCDVPESLCAKHEHFVPCVSQCNDCWSRGDCEPTFCQPGCDCSPGFFRDDNGECIPEKQCIAEEVSCGVNEEYTDCVNPCNDCIKQGQCQYNCEYGCDCKKGYFKDSRGVCIPAEQCEGVLDSRNCRSCRDKCPLNEQYYICKPTCKTTCENFNDTRVSCGADCRSGCFCKQGLVRRGDGACILPSECPQRCGLNEEYSVCGSACPESCENFGKSVMCNHQCVKGCFCKRGFIRGPQGTCIQPQLCPAKCGENEEYLQCGPACPLSCDNQVRTIVCARECVQGCFCKIGFIRGPDGKCINPAFCPVVCGVNEEFQKCGTACPVSCANITLSQTLPCPGQCVPGCFCKSGFIRGPDGSCIAPTSCPSICRENEEFQTCGTPCPATCHNHTNPRPCPTFCVRGCTCRPGYVKGPNGRCVLPQECPVVCGANQEFLECGPACPLSCTNYTLPNTHANNECHRGCFCKSGFVIGPDGSCIAITSCPPVCGENEVFQECGTACPVTCDNRLVPQQCTKRCVRGCFCAPGFIRGPYGKCMLPQQCPQVCGENEEFKECGTACPLTCANRTRQGLCPNTCVRGCFCRPNFVRDSSGRCILPQLCPVVCRENEEFKECGTACPPTCANFTSQRFCPSSCVRGCFCREGYVKDSSGRCVLSKLCPAVCKENEEFQQCGPACPITCDTISRPTAPCPLPCTSGCFCKPGFVKGPDGRCILPTFCPVVCRENEEFKECGTACPLTCANRLQHGICSNTCVRGCFCRPGFVKDASGRCILAERCPVVCHQNEEFKECGPGCPITCDTLTQIFRPCSRPCTKGCYCKPGFVRGPDGRCILPAFCPVVCGENEEFKECGTPCPLTCSNLTQQGICPTTCVRGCFCRPGFVKDASGRCILPERCPVVCNHNEEFKECGPGCPMTCDTLTHLNVPCSRPCTKGCFCKPGFVRGPDGRCIFPAFCPVVCGENEEFKECGPACPVTCSNNTAQLQCPLPCVKGCFCREGYVRDSAGNCILPQFCPVVCKRNEEFKECGPACQVTCDTLGVSAGVCPVRCEKGCFCKPGFVRDRNGNCILPSLCPVVCDVNEEFRECGSACPANCTNRFQTTICPAVCVRGCFCRDGFFRDANGKCVRPDFCPVVCKENEIFRECGPSCQHSCDSLSKPLGSCNQQCVKGCFCKPGYVRNREGRCILPLLCPVVCGENEEFQECGTACPPTCTNPNSLQDCRKTCVKGCFCRAGFVRNSAGKCVLPQFCPVVCKKNEEFKECGTACPHTCDDLGKLTVPCTLPCRKGCFCKQGYVRNREGDCILPNFCPVVCGSNEEFQECGTACPANCTNRLQPQLSCPSICVKGCFCRSGCVRNQNGECIPQEQCPIVCMKNEEFQECGTACPHTCDDLGKPTPPCTLPCRKGCFCKPGYVRNREGNCILPNFCPVVCGINEEFQECGTACPANCTNRLQSQFSCPSVCVKGCFCRSGFVRDQNGKCVPPEQCPVVCNKNEEFQECGTACPHTCDDLGKPTQPCTLPCRKGCSCKPGYVRNREGNCILPNFCPVVCGINEEFQECGTACPANCTNRLQPQISCPPVCVKGCFCRSGFVRDQNGKCVPPEQCPVVCNKNEEFQECGTACPHTCDDLGKPTQPCTLPCRKGCSCKPGYVRNREGNCILPNFCPVVCGINEEFQECGTACPANCTNRLQPQISCPPVCVKGCFCRSGFVRDQNGKCVPPEQCPVVCNKNEEFQECGTACPHTCDDLGKPIQPCTLPCRKGCFCKPGYVRNREGNCILTNFCPVVCGINEEFHECGTACPANCTNRLQPQRFCSTVCVKGCFCRSGFVRDQNGKCVPPEQCPVVCKENEEFQECGSACPHTCDDLGKHIAPCTLPCRKGCFCKPGYVRNREGDCILPNFCPVVCGENEEFKECGTACPANCTHRLGHPQCPELCVKGCFCRSGFLRNSEGKCIRPELCPVVCKENEQFLECGSACPLTCDSIGTPNVPCTLQCIKGCFCKPGYVRDRTGRCILPHFCPVVCGINEEFQECGTACPANCTNRLLHHSCPTTCVKGCFCRPGFVRDQNGKCVPPEQCPVVCRRNEEFKECGLPCQITCDNLGIPAAACPIPCTRGCFCKPGFVRNRDGNCVRPSLCPIVCGENEEFNQCGTACPATCTSRTEQRMCPAVCVKGCFCKPGFVRDPSGKCILPGFCPVVCRENEEFQECGTACPANCTSLHRSCQSACVKGCFCRPGFVRDPTGKCVRPDQCPVVCGENEVFQECGTACPANCTNPRPLRTCPTTCVRGCFCRQGYIRDPTGRCVRPEQCPVVCGGNEEFKQCGTACPANCTSPRPSCQTNCVRGCFCRLGFIRDTFGRCVRPEQCPVVCSENEVFQECGTACPANCSNPVPQTPCRPVCVRGCFCRPGFVRDPSGKCIRPETCPIVCGPLEVFKECGPICPANCTHPNPPLLGQSMGGCIRGCFCKEGLLRSPEGNCIPPEQCPPVCGENEQFEKCGSSCPPTCANPNPRRPCRSICNRGCFCKPGFVKDQNGKCVRPETCPAICSQNEEFQQCGPACPVTCTNFTNPRPCPLPCISGCFCKPGFVRGPDGRCIAPNFCPDDCSRPNEEFRECGPPCIRTCGRIDPRQRCDTICIKGCFCKDGFIRDIDGNCILPSECPIEPQKCPPGETFYACVPPCGNTCDTLDPDIVRSCNKVCRPGCFCRLGYVKRRDGKCVLPKQCPRTFEFRRVYNDEDETISPSANTPNPTTTDLLAERDVLSTNPTTLDISSSEIITPLLTTPVTTEATPVTTKATPVTTKATPVTTEATPVTTETTPATTETTPVTTKTTVVTTETTTVTTEINIEELPQSVSTVQSTSPTTRTDVTSLPSKGIKTTSTVVPTSYSRSTALTTKETEISIAADEKKPVSIPSILTSTKQGY